MGTETKSNSYSENTACGLNRVQKVSSDTNNSCENNAKYLSTNTVTKVTNSLTSSNVELSEQKVTESSPVPFVPIEIDENGVIEGAKEILKVIRPIWNLNYVNFKVIN